MFGLENYGQTSPRTIQGSLRLTHDWWPSLSKTAHLQKIIDDQWVNRWHVGEVSSIVLRCGRGEDKYKPQFPTPDKQNGLLVKGWAIDGPLFVKAAPSTVTVMFKE